MNAVARLHHLGRQALGDDFIPRDAQDRATEMIDATFGTERGQCAIEAPVGSGKSFAYLVPAFHRAAEAKESGTLCRTLVSTTGLSLQRQLLDKDMPAVAASVQDQRGIEVKYAMLKGRSNYVCGCKAWASACDFVEKNPRTASKSDVMRALGEVDDPASELLLWALTTITDQYSMSAPPVDRDSCPKEEGRRAALWSMISARDGSECFDRVPGMEDDEQGGGKEPPLGHGCGMIVALRQAGGADVLVTNHSSLGVQIVHEVPVIIGRYGIGDFTNIVIDEGHDFPSVVRSQSQETLSGSSVARLSTRLNTVISRLNENPWSYGLEMNYDANLHRQAYIGEYEDLEAVRKMVNLGKRFDQRVNEIAQEKKMRPGGFVDLESLEDPYVHEATLVSRGIGRALDSVLPPKSTVTAANKDVEAEMGNAAGRFLYGSDSHNNVARWIEHTQDGSVQLLYSDIDVSARCAKLFSTHRVVVVSGTLSDSSCPDMGLDAEVQRLDSPYREAYASSRLYLPIVSMETAACIGTPGGGGMHRLNSASQEYVQWCSEQICELVAANGGHAMVIAASRKNAEAYTKALRAMKDHDFIVYSQAEDQQRAIDAWIAEESSVIVGMRKLTTGVDARGETNSLVIIDRPPRARQNPLDDARVREISKTEAMSGKNIYHSRSAVYAGDASVVLGQSVGRLIRSVSDTGMVAVLDPRLGDPKFTNGSNPDLLAYHQHLGPGGGVSAWQSVEKNVEGACDWLRDRAASVRGALVSA